MTVFFWGEFHTTVSPLWAGDLRLCYIWMSVFRIGFRELIHGGAYLILDILLASFTFRFTSSAVSSIVRYILLNRISPSNESFWLGQLVLLVS